MTHIDELNKHGDRDRFKYFIDAIDDFEALQAKRREEMK